MSSHVDEYQQQTNQNTWTGGREDTIIKTWICSQRQVKVRLYIAWKQLHQMLFLMLVIFILLALLKGWHKALLRSIHLPVHLSRSLGGCTVCTSNCQWHWGGGAYHFATRYFVTYSSGNWYWIEQMWINQLLHRATAGTVTQLLHFSNDVSKLFCLIT